MGQEDFLRERKSVILPENVYADAKYADKGHLGKYALFHLKLEVSKVSS